MYECMEYLCIENKCISDQGMEYRCIEIKVWSIGVLRTSV